MSHERTPLISQTSTPNGFPPFLGEKHGPPYGVVEIQQYNEIQDASKPRISNGIAATPIIALIALGIGLALIFGVTLLLPQEQQLIQNILQQSPSNNDGEANVGSTYKDITIPQGRLRGFTKKSRQGRDYTAYYKVPYAEPPLGEFRFKDPISPLNPWQGLRSIAAVAPQCIQKAKYSKIDEAVGEEDCLYANIYVPHNSVEEPTSLPVMVYVHGGGFSDGNGSRYGADYFMDEPVILITFQFRLGAFGFLNTQDDVIHGNMGLKDQVQMLIWTRDNIQYFGGDPTKVTIFGNSGGGMAVSLLMLSPMARGLFQRAITQSGAGVCAGVPDGGFLNSDPGRTVQEVGRVLECDTTDSTAFLECLRSKDSAQIALVRSPPTMYTLTIENRNDNQVFMPDTPLNIMKTNPNQVPYMLGIVNGEGASEGLVLFRSEELIKQLNAEFEKIGGSILGVDFSEEELLRVKNFYFGDKGIGNDTVREVINMASDRGQAHCAYLSANMQSEFSPTYLYYLTKPPALSYADKTLPGFPAKELGIVAHADELQYLFLYYGYPEIPNGDPEYFEFSRYLVKQWVTFAENGSPTSDWQQYSPNSTFWFELNDNPGRTDVMLDRMNFWDQFTLEQLPLV